MSFNKHTTVHRNPTRTLPNSVPYALYKPFTGGPSFILFKTDALHDVIVVDTDCDFDDEISAQPLTTPSIYGFDSANGTSNVPFSDLQANWFPALTSPIELTEETVLYAIVCRDDFITMDAIDPDYTYPGYDHTKDRNSKVQTLCTEHLCQLYLTQEQALEDRNALLQIAKDYNNLNIAPDLLTVEPVPYATLRQYTTNLGQFKGLHRPK